LGEKLTEYIRDNKVEMLGEPLPSDKQQPIDFEGDGPMTFLFDIAVAPEFKAELTDKDKIDYYNIKVDDKIIDQQVQMYQSRSGQYEKADSYQANDMLKGDLRELDEQGNTKEGGITVSDAVMMPEYIKVDEQKKLFAEAKPGDIITFNPKKAYPENDSEIAALLKLKKEQVADLTADFSYQVTEISRFTPAAIDQKLFDQVFGEGTVKDEKEFRQKIADMIQPQLTENSDYKFLQDVRAYMDKKVGELTFPEALLKRIMQNQYKDKGADFVEKNFAQSIVELKWHLIKEQLVEAAGIKVEDEDVKAIAKEQARMQFAQYGMTNVPEEYLENYAEETLKKRENINGLVDRAVDVKLTEALKKLVKLNEKNVTLDEFNKMMEGK